MLNRIVLFLVPLVVYCLLALPIYSGDVKNHLVWAESIINKGTLGFYERDFPGFAFPNYPPLAMAGFALSLRSDQLLTQLVWWLNLQLPIFPSPLVHYLEWENTTIAFLKLPAILANIALAYGLYRLTNLRKKAYLLIIFNPALIYLSVVWGQIDVLPITLLVIAALAILSKKPILGAILLMLAVLSKQTSVIFLPLLFYEIFRQSGPKVTASAIAVALTIFFLSYLPFYGFDFTAPLKLFQLNFQLVAHSVAENSINLWGALFNFQRYSDEAKLWGITYQNIGLLLFVGSMLPLIVKYLKNSFSLERFMLLLLLINGLYFLLLTRMHERYLVGVVIYLTALASLNRRYLPALIFFSILHLLNLYRGLYQPDVALFNILVTSGWVLKGLVVGYVLVMVDLYRRFLRNLKS